MCALYAMARRIDDVGDGIAGRRRPGAPTDGKAEPDDKLASLDEYPASLSLLRERLAAGRWPQYRPATLCWSRSPMPRVNSRLPVDALQELVEGCAWDITGRR